VAPGAPVGARQAPGGTDAPVQRAPRRRLAWWRRLLASGGFIPE
jgi:hypothetical protein